MNGSVQGVATQSDKALVTQKAVKVLANAIYQQMQEEGYKARDIISVSSQLIDMVTNELQRDDLQKS